MNIDNSKVKISFDFTPEEYFLCKSDDKMLGDYTLNYRIDRSFKGKDDDIGMPRIYLTGQEAEMCRENGFIEII
jgi:hypothetical protein